MANTLAQSSLMNLNDSENQFQAGVSPPKKVQLRQDERIENYSRIKRKYQEDKAELQKQIDDMKKDIEVWEEKVARIEKVDERVDKLEELGNERQNKNEVEFEKVHEALGELSGRLDQIDEYQRVDREHRLQQQQQQQQQEAQQNQNQQRPTRVLAPPKGKVRAPRTRGPRTNCPKCRKELSMAYLPNHLKRKKCK